MSSALNRKTKFHPDAEQSATLPGYYYYDPRIFELEKERIFFRTWQLAGYLADLSQPGDYVTVQLFDQNIIVARGRDRRLRAFYNVCQHRGHELLIGRGRTNTITCPYHAWSYDLQGRLKAAGNSENVAGFDLADFGLTEVRVEEFAHMAFINLDVNAPSLASQAGELAQQMREVIPHFDDLKLVRRDPFSIKANWKFIFDALECYHCPHIHSSKMGSKDSFMLPSFDSTEHGIWSHHVARGNREVIEGNKRNLNFLGQTNEIKDVHIGGCGPT